ncbi:MAG: hypothetical protein LBT14_04270 [Treponema sp.]|nr:hypothetical protein [Treponema sp.]
MYNHLLAERIKTDEALNGDQEARYTHQYKTEKTYKAEFEFLKEIIKVPKIPEPVSGNYDASCLFEGEQEYDVSVADQWFASSKTCHSVKETTHAP